MRVARFVVAAAAIVVLLLPAAQAQAKEVSPTVAVEQPGQVVLTGVTVDNYRLRGLRLIFDQNGSAAVRVKVRWFGGQRMPKLQLCRTDEKDNPGRDCVKPELQSNGTLVGEIDLGCDCRAGIEIINSTTRLARYLTFEVTYPVSGPFLSVLLPPREGSA